MQPEQPTPKPPAFGRRLWKAILLLFAAVAFTVGSMNAQPLTWWDSGSNALALALSQGKLVLLMAGRHSCDQCNYMQNTVCETTSPPIKAALENGFVCWYSDVDTSAEWAPYASGLGAFSLPLICAIDPSRPQAFLDRTTGTQTPDFFYVRLQSLPRAVLTQAAISRITVTTSGNVRVARLNFTHLTAWATNRVERCVDVTATNTWVLAGTFVSNTGARDWTEPVNTNWARMFYRVQSRK